MLARLWWKDARQFWPIWATLALTAEVSQWLLLRYGGQGARDGLLVVVAMAWVVLYGFAVSSASFAGERENDTLAFLDMIPVSRMVLWKSKVSFALVTTIALAVALAAMAWVGTDRFLGWGLWSRPDDLAFGAHRDTAIGRALIVIAAVAVLLEVLGWGLFWSSVSGNAMIAAVLAMVCSAFGLSLLRGQWASESDDLVAAVPWRLALSLATTAASALVIHRGGRPRRPWGDPYSREVAAGTARARKARRPRRRVVSPVLKALAWQTSREVWPVWWRVTAIGIGLFAFTILVRAREEPGLVILMIETILVVAGVNVFGAENRGKTQRFLAHHGARPGVVWGVKVAVWVAWLALPWFVLGAYLPAVRGPAWWLALPVGFWVMMTGWAVGLLAGMVIRRGITAGLVAVIGVVVVSLPQAGLLHGQMLPVVVPFLVPPAILAVSWAWSGDWMIERPGPGRWFRLALWLASAFAFVFAVHVGIRVGSIPADGPGFDVAAFERAAFVDRNENAAELYREAVRRTEVVGAEAALAYRWGEPPDEAGVAARRAEREQILDLIRRASAMPRCQFVPLDRVTMLGPYNSRDLYPSGSLEPVVADSARKRLDAGDLDGAWGDLMVMFRMARQMTGPVPMGETYMGLNTERRALGLAMEWSADRRQTPGRVRGALDDYLKLPPMPSVVETIRAEAILVQNTLNLPADDLSRLLTENFPKGKTDYEKIGTAFQVAAITAPWEVARARRVVWLIFREMSRNAADDPSVRPQRNEFVDHYDVMWRQLEWTTPLAQRLLPARDSVIDSNDRNEVARRALLQILALRSWQLSHGGKLPELLTTLVMEDVIPALPDDPYRKGIFSYVKSEGQRLLPLGRIEPYWPDVARKELRPTTGQRLLYSVGPDRKDDGAWQNVNNYNGLGDTIFPIPDGDGGRD